jgi:hypothetical protein
MATLNVPAGVRHVVLVASFSKTVERLKHSPWLSSTGQLESLKRPLRVNHLASLVLNPFDLAEPAFAGNILVRGDVSA